MERVSFTCNGEANDTKSATTMAGMAGLEPASEGVKVPCLTTWLHPCMRGIQKRKAGAEAPAFRLEIKMGWVMGLEPTTPGTTIRCSAN